MNEMQMRGFMWLFKEQWGFDTQPGASDFDAYAKALLCCANGDGELAKEERDWVIGYGAAFGAPAEVLEGLLTYTADEEIEDVVARTTGVDQTRRSVIFDAIRACSADGDYADGEKSVVRRMAGKLGIDEAEVLAIEEQYAKELVLMGSRIKTIYPDGTPF